MQQDWLGLTGKVCVVTGAGGGIGQSISRALAEAGAKLALIDRTPEIAEMAVNGIRAGGGEALAIACDIASPQSVAEAVDQCNNAFGRADVLVNNAAVIRAGLLADLSLGEWNEVIGVNLTGYFVCAQAFGAVFRAQKSGSLVHVASISGLVPQAYSGAYSVSKAGVAMLSRVLAVEWGEFGVRSNVVCPALVRTPMSEAMYLDPELRARREGAIPLRRIGTPDEIADAVVFLASDRASYINGEELLVDGGFRQNALALIPRPGFDRPKD